MLLSIESIALDQREHCSIGIQSTAPQGTEQCSVGSRALLYMKRDILFDCQEQF